MSTRQDWDAPPAAPRAVRSPEGRRAGWIPLSECPSALGSDFRRPRRPEKPRPWFSAASVPPPVQALSSGCGQPPWGVCVRLLGNHTKPRPPPPPQPPTQTAGLCTVCGAPSLGPPPRAPGPARPCTMGALLPGLHPSGATAVPSLSHGHAQPGPGTTARPARRTRCPWGARTAPLPRSPRPPRPRPPRCACPPGSPPLPEAPATPHAPDHHPVYLPAGSLGGKPLPMCPVLFPSVSPKP